MVVDTFPIPKTIKHVRQFLGLANFYRRFVPNFSHIASPLNNLLKQDVAFSWNVACQKAFDTLKRNLVNPPILSYPDSTQEFILTTDASKLAIAYILSQKRDGKECVIEYGGRAIRKNEKAFSSSDLEGLAVLEGIKAYRPYLVHDHFKVITDHSALQYLKNVKADTGRLARWAIQLQSYDYEVIHRKGLKNKNADALSRREYDTTEENPAHASDDILPFSEVFTADATNPNPLLETTFQYDTLPKPDPTHATPCSSAFIATIQSIDIIKDQQKCPEIGPLYTYIDKGVLPLDNQLALKILAQADDFGLEERVLTHLYYPRAKGKTKTDRMVRQVVIPTSLRSTILTEFHDSLGHFAFDRTYNALKAKYYWPNMYRDVYEYTHSCDMCQRAKPHYHSKPAPLHPLPIESTFDRLHIDFVGPLKTSSEGHKHILVITDSFSKWCEAFPVHSQETDVVAKILYREIFTRYGAPRSIVSDRGQVFMSKLISAICELFAVKRHFTSAYHPASNAGVERFNGVLGTALRTYVKDDQSDWHDMIPGILMAYRSTPAIRSTGYSPYYLVFGKTMQLPIDISLVPKPSLTTSHRLHIENVIQNLQLARQIATENAQQNQATNKTIYDRKAKTPTFSIGDLVLLHNPKVPLGHSKKLHRPYSGPWYISEEGPHGTFKLHHSVTHKAMKSFIHPNRLKPFSNPTTRRYHTNDNTPHQHPSQNDTPITTTKQVSVPDITNNDQQQQTNLPTTTIDNTDDTDSLGNDNNISDSNIDVVDDMADNLKVIEKVKKCTPAQGKHKGKKWCQVKYKDNPRTEWLIQDLVPEELLRQYHIDREARRKKRRRKPIKKTFFIRPETLIIYT